ncbi:macrophage mannose receptor 1-like [Acanthopagrus latus]|uniref:macrophage mannose receptor 1-like n=1 Tax=Acanthopagrus latus TaxID=8177 RepID=UPI00187C4819|nr:macrophage mannose receptor 1-like [Acanthopagrus latus]
MRERERMTSAKGCRSDWNPELLQRGQGLCKRDEALLTELPGHPPATSLKCHIRANREPPKMDAVLLLIMAASGLSAVSSQLRRQYHFVYDQKNMTEAQKYCRATYTDLATVDNMEDVKILINTVDTSKASNLFWIGLYDDVNSWRWSLSNTSFYRDGEAEFRLWWPGQPDNSNSREHCTVMFDGQWNDVDCMTRYRSVCMDVRGLKVTFVLIETLMNWTEAQSYCREHHTDLASVRNMTEHQRVAGLVPAGQFAFIGLYRDSWKWSDGSDSSFRHWKQGQPANDVGNDACVVADFSGSGEWWDDPCDRNRPFICYITVTTKQVIKVRLVRKDSSLDLNDPAVMEQMLKEVQQRLKDQGVKGDVKLSWRKQADGKVFHEEEEETKEKKTRRKRDEI